MARIEKLLEYIRANPKNVRFSDLSKICDHYFEPRQEGTSHRVYKTPWAGDPRVNIQKGKNGEAKAYQVKQVIAAIEKIKGEEHGRL